MWAQIAKQHEFNRRSFTDVKRHALMVYSPQVLYSAVTLVLRLVASSSGVHRTYANLPQ